MSVTLPKDAARPSHADSNATAGKFRFYTKSGWLTPYALSCGYVQIRGNAHTSGDSGARLELHPYGGGYVVTGDGRWIRGESTTVHVTLESARRAFASMDHKAISEGIAAAHR